MAQQLVEAQVADVGRLDKVRAGWSISQRFGSFSSGRIMDGVLPTGLNDRQRPPNGVLFG